MLREGATERARQLLLRGACTVTRPVAVDRRARARAAFRAAAGQQARRVADDRDAARRARGVLAAVDRSDVQAELSEQWSDVEQRRAQRERRSLAAGRVFRCFGCKAFVASVSHRCPHCGFYPDRGWLT